MLVQVLVVFSVLVIVALVVILAKSESRDGYLSKFAVITGMKFEYLEKQRWIFVGSSKQDSKSTKDLVVAFAGGALRMAMMPQPEFVRTLSGFDCDKLFITDPLQSWYLNDPENQWKGYEYHEQKLRDLTRKYDRVMFIGNCMGGTGALLFSHLASHVVVFNPQNDLGKMKSFLVNMTVKRIPQSTFQLFQQRLSENVSKCKKITNHVGSSKLDLEQLESLEKMCAHSSNLCVVKHEWGNDNLPGSLKKHDELVPIIQKSFNEMTA